MMGFQLYHRRQQFIIKIITISMIAVAETWFVGGSRETSSLAVLAGIMLDWHRFIP